MAIAEIKETCAECGEVFTHRKECWNRRDADSYEIWARRNVTLCPACARKEREAQRRADAMAMLEKYGATLPDIEGVSDKQVAYAENLRIRHLIDNSHEVKAYCLTMAALNDEEQRKEMEAVAAEQGTTVEAATAEWLAKVRKTHLVMTCSSARQIIDGLNK